MYFISWHCCSLHGAATPLNSFNPFSISAIQHPVFGPRVGCEHLPLYLSGSDTASQETAISGSCQQVLVGFHNVSGFGACIWDGSPGGGSLWMVIPSVSALNFDSVTPSMGILFPLLRRIKVSTLWSSFLSFIWFVNYILDILSFWANIHLSVSAYHMCSYVIGLPQ